MYKKSILRNNSGFTLMELLVSALAGGILILGNFIIYDGPINRYG